MVCRGLMTRFWAANENPSQHETAKSPTVTLNSVESALNQAQIRVAQTAGSPPRRL